MLPPDTSPIRTAAPCTARHYGGVSGAERQAQRRMRFIEAGIRVFARDGYAGATTRTLAAEAGLTQRYFYESFAGIEDLFLTVLVQSGRELERGIRAAMAAAPADVASQLRAGIGAYFAGIDADRAAGRVFLIEALAVGSITEPLQKRFADWVTALLQPVVERSLRPAGDGGPAADVDFGLLTAGYIGSINHIGLQWATGGFATPLERVTATAVSIVVGSLRSLGVEPPRAAIGRRGAARP